jgi:ubiquinone/menaquinone biosynthesis C-methylase UbiE
MNGSSLGGSLCDVKDRQFWEANATTWAAFARGPEPDAYPEFSPRFFEFLPAAPRRILEVGSGEGRVCRDLRARGYEPVGIDGSPTLVELARQADPGGEYIVADASALPFPDAAFELVVADNVLMDVDELNAAVVEIARVLSPGGRLAACITHPFADAGRFSERRADAPFVVEGSYLARHRFIGSACRNGVEMPFRGWANPLHPYFDALEAAGLLVEALREPEPLAETIEMDPAEARWARIPNFLFLRAVKPLR